MNLSMSWGAGERAPYVSNHIPKKYSTRVLFTVMESRSPKATTGAITSPRLNSSVITVNLYVGLVTLEVS